MVQAGEGAGAQVGRRHQGIKATNNLSGGAGKKLQEANRLLRFSWTRS